MRTDATPPSHPDCWITAHNLQTGWIVAHNSQIIRIAAPKSQTVRLAFHRREFADFILESLTS